MKAIATRFFSMTPNDFSDPHVLSDRICCDILALESGVPEAGLGWRQDSRSNLFSCTKPDRGGLNEGVNYGQRREVSFQKGLNHSSYSHSSFLVRTPMSLQRSLVGLFRKLARTRAL